MTEKEMFIEKMETERLMMKVINITKTSFVDWLVMSKVKIIVALNHFSIHTF